MRLLFCVNRDIYANLALNHILPHCAQDDCMVFFSEKVGGKAATSPALDFLRFYEQELPNQYLFPLYDHLPNTENQHLKTFRQLSQACRTPMQGIRNINAPEVLQHVAQFQPDLLISIRFGQILKEAVIQQPRYGVINLHSGLLPDYRGILATFWSMLHDRAEYGYTLHSIQDASIDTGHIIQKTRLPVDPNRSLFHHIMALYPLGAAAILEAIHQFRQGKQPQAIPQSLEVGNYYGMPTSADFEQFRQKGYRLLDEADYSTLLRQYHPSIPVYEGTAHSPDCPTQSTVHATV